MVCELDGSLARAFAVSSSMLVLMSFIWLVASTYNGGFSVLNHFGSCRPPRTMDIKGMQVMIGFEWLHRYVIEIVHRSVLKVYGLVPFFVIILFPDQSVHAGCDNLSWTRQRVAESYQ